MFPYRRGNQRKRTKGNPPRRVKSGGNRRLPGTARELLPLLQPTTKALAQVLAGNAKASGQFVHARNVVERADQLIAEQQVERLGLRDREEFLEQLARLKLTVSDAEEEFGSEVAEAEEDEGDVDDEGLDAAAYEGVEGEEIDEEVLEERRREAEARARHEAEIRAREEAQAEAERKERLRRVALALMQPAEEQVNVEPVPVAPGPMHFEEAEAYVRRQPAKRAARSKEPAAEAAGERPATRSRTTRPKLTMRGAERDDPAARTADEGLASKG
jgi:dTMP kinase